MWSVQCHPLQCWSPRRHIYRTVVFAHDEKLPSTSGFCKYQVSRLGQVAQTLQEWVRAATSRRGCHYGMLRLHDGGVHTTAEGNATWLIRSNSSKANCLTPLPTTTNRLPVGLRSLSPLVLRHQSPLISSTRRWKASWRLCCSVVLSRVDDDAFPKYFRSSIVQSFQVQSHKIHSKFNRLES